MTRPISEQLLALVKEFEQGPRGGPALVPYECPGAVWTIGWGATLGVDGQPVTESHRAITKAEAEALLERDLKRFRAAVEKLVTEPVRPNQIDALTSFAFNVGPAALGRSTLLKKLNAGDIPGAAAEFHRWNRVDGQVLRGLVARRAREASLFLERGERSLVAVNHKPVASAEPSPGPASTPVAVAVGVAGTAATALNAAVEVARPLKEIALLPPELIVLGVVALAVLGIVTWARSQA